MKATRQFLNFIHYKSVLSCLYSIFFLLSFLITVLWPMSDLQIFTIHLLNKMFCLTISLFSLHLRHCFLFQDLIKCWILINIFSLYHFDYSAVFLGRYYFKQEKSMKVFEALLQKPKLQFSGKSVHSLSLVYLSKVIHSLVLFVFLP